MMKVINAILSILFLLSLLIICSVGVNIIQPFFTCNLDDFQIEKWNNLFLNLSYGYVVSYFTYFLTVLIPLYNRKNVVNNTIKHYVGHFSYMIFSKFYLSYSKTKRYTEFSSVINFETHIYPTKDELDNIIEIYQSLNELQQYVNNDISKECGRDKFIKEIRIEHDNFLNHIVPYENFLEISQLKIINQIRTTSLFSMYFTHECKDKEDDIERINFEELKKYITLLVNLRNSIL